MKSLTEHSVLLNSENSKIPLKYQYERLLLAIKFLLNEINYESLNTKERNNVVGYSNIIKQIFSEKLDDEYLVNLKYGISQILMRCYDFSPNNHYILLDFLKFLENFCSKVDKRQTLFNNFEKLFDGHIIPNQQFLIEKLYSFVFLGNKPKHTSFYELSVFKSSFYSIFNDFSYVKYLCHYLFSLYGVFLLNTIDTSKDVSELSSPSHIIDVLVKRFNLFNALIYRKFIKSSNIEIILFLVIFIEIQIRKTQDRIFGHLSIELLIYHIVVIVNNFDENTQNELKDFLIKEMYFDIPLTTDVSYSKQDVTSYIKKRIAHIFGSLKLNIHPTIFPIFKLQQLAGQFNSYYEETGNIVCSSLHTFKYRIKDEDALCISPKSLNTFKNFENSD